MQNYLNNGNADIHTRERELTYWPRGTEETYIFYRDLKPEWQEYLDNDYDYNEI